MKSYAGKVLRVNLSTGKVSTEDLNMEIAKKYLGGRGLGSKMLFDEVDPKVDALSSENKLIVITGPLTGTAVPTGGRYMVVTKSPLTGAIACSNSGGHWGPEFKNCGYDALIVEGKADKPVYLSIVGKQVEIKDAAHVWGKLVEESTDILMQEAPEKSRVLAIGPAGEKLSRLAAVINDKDRAAGRSGVGAVMGSKNLKAIVVKGDTKVQVTDAAKLKDINSQCLKMLKENGVTGQGLPAYGTAILVNIVNEAGVHPTNNWQLSQFDKDKADKISGESMAEDYLIKKNPCYRCPIACGRWVKMEGKPQGVGGPEYEPIWGFGADCGIDNMAAIIEANFWCNQYGLDAISTSSTIAAAMELYQKGYIKEADLEDGPALEWGNAPAIIEWTKRMGDRQGILGEKLSEGSYRLCASYGVPELSMSVKKQELPAYDPRGIQGIGLQYATSNRGGCHVRGYLISPEILGIPEQLDRFATEGKAQWTKIFQDLTAVIDALGMCLFTSFALGAQEYAELYNAAAGTEHTVESILEAGERIYNIERLFNVRAGIDGSQDTLPQRLLEEPVADGPAKGWVHKLNELLPEYYELRGWKEGVPTAETLQRLEVD